MKIKAIEIVIVILVLFFLAALFGCKEKVKTNESNEPKTYTAEELDKIYKDELAWH